MQYINLLAVLLVAIFAVLVGEVGEPLALHAAF